MKPSNEEKARFFAQYWEQNVARFGYVDWDSLNPAPVNGQFFSELAKNQNDASFDNYLELFSLSSITEEHAIEVAKIVHNDYKGYAEYDDLEKEDGYRFLCDIYGYNETRGLLFETHIPGAQANNSKYIKSIEVADYLRSKSYALPFNGHSVEEMISYGWLKLK